MQNRKKSVIAALMLHEDMYEKFQVNSTYGLAGRAFRSSHPML